MLLTPVYPPKLRPGDHVRVVAPSRSRSLVMEHDHFALIEDRYAEMGLSLGFGEHVDERDAFDSSAIESRVDDLHAAFADPAVQGILTVIGGFNSNELFPYLDWDPWRGQCLDRLSTRVPQADHQRGRHDRVDHQRDPATGGGRLRAGPDGVERHGGSTSGADRALPGGQ